jgi:hypothetical protein
LGSFRRGMATGIEAAVGSLQKSISGLCAIPAPDDLRQRSGGARENSPAVLASAEPIGELCMRSSKLKLTDVD